MDNSKILNNEIIKELGSTVAYIIDGDLVLEALAFAKEIESATERNKEALAGNVRIKNVYTKYIVSLKYIALPRLEKEEVLAILKTDLLLGINLPDYDLYYKLKEKISSLDTQSDVDDFKRQVQNALQVNNEIVGDKKIIIGGRELMPSVANWLKDYNAICMSEEFSDTCLEQYFSSNINIVSLPEQKQNLIKKVIILFENLKRSIGLIDAQRESITVALPDGSLGKYQDGKVVKITQNGKAEEEYKISETEKQAIENALHPEEELAKDMDDMEFVSIDEKKGEMLEFLKKNIFTENYNNKRIEEAANLIIFSILVKDLNFKIEMEKTLYQNTTKITHKNFVLNKKAKAPSIKNWLRYFIKTHGSGIFNNLELSKFILEADNCEKLDDEEKKTLSKLLHTYRNIKFFPQSMENLPPEQWEIIPLEKKEVKSRASRLVHPPKKKGREALITELKGNIDDYAEGSLEREILEEESAKDQEHHKLLLLAKKYPEGSLERRAVEDEIAKLEK